MRKWKPLAGILQSRCSRPDGRCEAVGTEKAVDVELYRHEMAVLKDG